MHNNAQIPRAKANGSTVQRIKASIKSRLYNLKIKYKYKVTVSTRKADYDISFWSNTLYNTEYN